MSDADRNALVDSLVLEVVRDAWKVTNPEIGLAFASVCSAIRTKSRDARVDVGDREVDRSLQRLRKKGALKLSTLRTWVPASDGGTPR